MKYPEFLMDGCTLDSFMHIPKEYQEFFIRLYYFDTTDEMAIPDTIPVEHIEEYIVNKCEKRHLDIARGFASAKRIEQTKSNNDFMNDAGEFFITRSIIRKIWYRYAISYKWIETDISEKDFDEVCPF